MENGQFVKPCSDFLILILGMLVHPLLVVVRVWQGCGKGVCWCGEDGREGVAGVWQGCGNGVCWCGEGGCEGVARVFVSVVRVAVRVWQECGKGVC